jgi:hypothetical protein
MNKNAPRNDDKNKDRIVGNKIILDGEGEFPKDLVFLNREESQEYKIIKSKYGKFRLGK